jgi:hypothetical protein
MAVSARTCIAGLACLPLICFAQWQQAFTPDGQPGFEGNWLDSGATPLERPKALEGRAMLTDAEIAAMKERAERLFAPTSRSDFAANDAFFLALLTDQPGQRTHPFEFEHCPFDGADLRIIPGTEDEASAGGGRRGR